MPDHVTRSRTTAPDGMIARGAFRRRRSVIFVNFRAAAARESPSPALAPPGLSGHRFTMRRPVPRPVRDRRIAEEAGRRGERLAGWWLRLKGWSILDRRVRTPLGEVDLIAKKGALIAFVEVKARRTAAGLDHAIDQRRLARVAAAAEALMPRYATVGEDIRVDVILLAPGTRPRHIENAWIGY